MTFTERVARCIQLNGNIDYLEDLGQSFKKWTFNPAQIDKAAAEITAMINNEAKEYLLTLDTEYHSESLMSDAVKEFLRRLSL